MVFLLQKIRRVFCNEVTYDIDKEEILSILTSPISMVPNTIFNINSLLLFESDIKPGARLSK